MWNLQELQYVWSPITKKLVNTYFMVVDGLYLSTYAIFMTTYIVNRPATCGGTAVAWFLLSSLVIISSMSCLKGTVNYITFIPNTRNIDIRCYIYVLVFMYLWGLFNIYMNECYFSDSNQDICKDIYDCKTVYLFLMINSNVYFVWINSIIIHILICSGYHFRKKEKITSIVEITELVTEGIECSICLDGFSSKTAVKTHCNHIYHYECIIEWMGVQMTCPICRENL